MNSIFTKMLLLFCSLSIALPSVAQDVTKKRQKVDFTPSHEFRLGVGVLNTMADSPFGGMYNYYDGYNPYSNNYFSDDSYDQHLRYDAPSVTTAAISAGYSYNITRMLSVGATFTYAGVSHKVRDRITDQVINRDDNHNYMLTPMVRFSYFNRPMVRMYTQMGVGLRTSKTVYEREGKSKYSSNETFITGQVTFFGISVGRKLFGFAEVGYGNQGVYVWGVGYKFNNKK